MRRGTPQAAKPQVQPAAVPLAELRPADDWAGGGRRVVGGGWRALRSTDIDSLAGDELKQYARQAGVMQRDVDGLTENRLRQNVKALVNEHLELICEG